MRLKSDVVPLLTRSVKITALFRDTGSLGNSMARPLDRDNSCRTEPAHGRLRTLANIRNVSLLERGHATCVEFDHLVGCLYISITVSPRKEAIFICTDDGDIG